MSQATQGLHCCYGTPNTESSLITLDYDCRLLVLWPFPWWGHERGVTLNLIMSNRTTSPVAIKQTKKNCWTPFMVVCAYLKEHDFSESSLGKTTVKTVLGNTSFSSSVSAIHLFILIHTDTPVHQCDSWRHQKFSWQRPSRLLYGQQLSRQSHRPGNTDGQMDQ